MTYPSPTLPHDAVPRLLEEWERLNIQLLELVEVHEAREWSREEEIHHAHIIRRIAVLSTTLHGGAGQAPLTAEERQWLIGFGVALGIPSGASPRFPRTP